METLTDIQSNFKSQIELFLREFHEQAIPDIRKMPYVGCKYAFAWFYHTYNKNKDICFSGLGGTQRAMFPLFETTSNDNVWGWLCLNKVGPYAFQLEYHVAGQPYQSQESYDFPRVSVWGGYFEQDTLTSDSESGSPQLRFNIKNSKEFMDRDFESVVKMNKFIADMILIQTKFKSVL